MPTHPTPTTGTAPAPTEAHMVSTGRSSMQADVEMHTEDLLTCARLLATRGGFTMIALDADGRPTPIRPLQDRTGPESGAWNRRPAGPARAHVNTRTRSHPDGRRPTRELPAKPVTR
ncbi:hypothetical protein H4F98_06225 [Lysobacter spongiae]|uniref:Uncharacterized protein n=2 Tax=Marilutibacter spongiae TaxID=2025720 RepID=A0A7W3TLF8_9GAMM|nr:hypothetical protein [Lysobacter spongiae]